MKKPILLTTIVVSALRVAAPSAFAQNSDIEELKAMVKEMRKTISEQNARIASLEKKQASPKEKTAAKPTQSGPAVKVAGFDVPVGELPSNAMPKQRAMVQDSNDLNQLQQAAPRVNNDPIDPKLKGFIAIPGTDTIFKIGGSARVDTIVDFKNNGNPNLFTPSTIPVPDQPGWNGGERTTLESKGTRLSLEIRRPVPWEGTLRIYTEYDFFNNSSSPNMDFRTRHFYGQAWNFLIGQTFTAFMDADAFPDTVDYQGPNGIVNRRQPQLRYTLPVYQGEASKLLLFASIEQPDSKIDTDTDEFPVGATPVSHTPDGVLGLRWEGERGHLQAASVFRDLSFESDDGQSGDTFGWGVSLGGSLKVFEKDKFSVQATYGQGVSRYINDLGGESLDAAFNDGRLEALPVFAAMAGYTHHWGEHWRSTVSGGYVHVDAPVSLGGFTIDTTLYGSANLMWHPTESFRMGLEYLYGHKETLNGSERDAHRLDFVVRYDLVR